MAADRERDKTGNKESSSRLILRGRGEGCLVLDLSVHGLRENEPVRGAPLSLVRRKLIRRMMDEAAVQGERLTYDDLELILLTSRSTIKRDMRALGAVRGGKTLRGSRERA